MVILHAVQTQLVVTGLNGGAVGDIAMFTGQTIAPIIGHKIMKSDKSMIPRLFPGAVTWSRGFARIQTPVPDRPSLHHSPLFAVQGSLGLARFDSRHLYRHLHAVRRCLSAQRRKPRPCGKIQCKLITCTPQTVRRKQCQETGSSCNLTPVFDSSISPMVPLSKMAREIRRCFFILEVN